MIVSNDSSGRFLSQQTHPRLALTSSKAVNPQTIELSLPDRSKVRTSISEIPPIRKAVSVWSSQVMAQDAGDSVSLWLSQFLETDVRLVGIDRNDQRFISDSDTDQTGFADGYPLLVLSRASMDDLNEHLDFPIEICRFRPNIIVDDCQPYDEDRWSRIRIGDCLFRASGPRTRCVIATIDPETGQREGKEPLHTLAQYRETEQGILFGQNFTNESKSGTIEVGMEIEIL